MSLLIEALKKAEDEARKRKLTAAGTQPFIPVPSGLAAMADDSLKRAQSTGHASAPADPQPPTAMDFPELSLASTTPSAVVDTHNKSSRDSTGTEATPDPSSGPADMGASSVHPVKQSNEKAQRDPTAMAAIAARSAAYSAGVTNNPLVSGSVFQTTSAPEIIPAVTPRQAKSAAGVMAGGEMTGRSVKASLRLTVLILAVVLMTLPIAAFLLFGNNFFTSPSTVIASSAQAPDRAKTAPPALPALPAAINQVSPTAGTTSPVPPAAPAAANTQQVPVASSSRARTAAARPVDAVESTRMTAAREPGSLSLRSNATKPASAMDSAYAAYQAGRPEEAGRLYREVLKSDPGQRDAWLGLAVIAHAANQREAAMDAYKRVLRLEPQNGTALAGISSLSNDSEDSRQESRLRELLARSPQEADLNHALGLVLSAEKRWSEAQPLFFKAHALAPLEPQFAYNLAITLDHLRKHALAIQYYETALTLAQGKNAGFDESSARKRLTALKTAAIESRAP